MFTGIVEELGEVVSLAEREGSARLTVRGPIVSADAATGSSIAVNGVCLTVTALSAGDFSADVMQETLQHSALGSLRPGSPVNLERPLRLADRLGGHLVQGHVDGVGVVLSRHVTTDEARPLWEVLRISLPVEVARYVVHKGSVTVDGVSLTVSQVGTDWFEVSLIPTTLRLTTLGTRDVGALVNLEVDVIAKYVERLVGGLH